MRMDAQTVAPALRARAAKRTNTRRLAVALATVLPLLWCVSAYAVVITPIAPEATIKPSTSQSFTLSLAPEMLQRKLALSLLARLEYGSLGGSTYSMEISVNGEPLRRPRLLNKALETEMLNGVKLEWYGSGAWRVAYSPDYAMANGTDLSACFVDRHAYDFVFDLTGLLKVGQNDIIIRHSEPTIPNVLLLKDIALVDAPERVAPLEAVEDPNDTLRLIAPTDRSKVPYTLTVTPDGGIKVTCGKLTREISSSFSYPNVGWNTLGAGDGQQEMKLGPIVSARRGEHILSARGRYYRLERTINQLPDHIAVSDRLTNLTGTDLHISVKYTTSTVGLTDGEVYLRGRRIRTMQGSEKGGDNPTVLLRSGSDGLGFVAEDDVLRAQSAQIATADPAAAGLVDDYFMLPPYAEYELRWSIYPVPAGDYFDFVNAVRLNWGVNFTVPGAFAFPPHPTVERAQTPDLKAWLNNGSLSVVCCEIPMPEPLVLSQGLAFLQEPAEQQRLKDQADRLRAAKPGLKVLQYLHVYITRLDAAVDAYKDAALRGAEGKQLAYEPGQWKPTFWLFLPTTTNAYGREMNKTFDLILDPLGFDGIFWDELAYSRNEMAYGVEDGHSAIPDPKTMTVAQKMAFTPLYCQAYQVQQARRVLNAGKILIGNGPPLTETMTKIHFPRFVETSSATNLRYAHLYCPLGLSSPDRVESAEDIIPSIRSHLDNGGLWYYYCKWDRVFLTHPTATAHMYPFTPIELHEGYLIGRERILTDRSGIFGWNDKSRHRVFVYGRDGRLVEGFTAPTRTVKGCTYTELRLPPGAMGIIERQ